MYRHIVHANDGSTNSMRALEVALEMAELWGAELDILVLAAVGRRRSAAEHLRRAIVRIADRHSIPFHFHVFGGPPVSYIADFADQANADLLIVGASRGFSMIELVRGRRSDRIVRRVKCSVLIAR